MKTIAAAFLCLAFSLPAIAQMAEMPSAKNFSAGDTWTWVQTDGRTKLEDARITRTAVETDAGLRFRQGGTNAISNYFIGIPGQKQPWRLWPLQIGKTWTYEEDWKDGAATGTFLQKVTVVAYEEVTVPAGKFMAFRIEHRGGNGGVGASGYAFNKAQTDIYWYAPAVMADVRRTSVSQFRNWIRELASYKLAHPGNVAETPPAVARP